ncbi:MAG: hypothetical protein CK543_06020 [Flavobacteriales bacterium]|nr:MAG: hypothetical protein CK543_06020 [Flavobacteriales bacterium]
MLISLGAIFSLAVCCPPLAVSEKHNGPGQDVFFIDITPNNDGICICGIENKKIGLAAVLKFPKKQLPWLTNWQHEEL